MYLFQRIIRYMSGMTYGRVKCKISRPSENLFSDMYRRGPSSEVSSMVSHTWVQRRCLLNVLPASGYRNCNGDVNNVGSNGNYWSSTPNGSDNAWNLNFNSGNVNMNNNNRCNGQSVRLVQAFTI